MEEEAKYTALQRIKAKDIESIDWAPFALGPRTTHELRDTVLDTAERTLSQQRIALRIRHDGSRYHLTLKSPGSVHGAVHQRHEIEQQLDPQHRDQRAHWPAEIADPVEQLVGSAQLMPLIKIRNRRRTWLVSRADVIVAELALDRGKIEADGRSMPMHELEIELKDQGTPADLQALCNIVEQQLPLQPEQRSKMQRGVMLLEQRERTPELEAARDLTPMQPTADLAEAGRSILAKYAHKLHQALPVARIGSDPEGVHDARVAIRRIRATLAALSTAVYDPEQVKPLRKQLKQLATSLGSVRDADVFLLHLAEHAAQLGPQAAQLTPLQDLLRTQRDTGREQMLARLASSKTTKLLQQLDDFVLTPGAGLRQLVDDPHERPRTLVRHWLGSIIWDHYEQVRAYEVDLSSAEPATLHRLRIAIKHLRYTLELFMPALDKEAKSLHEQLVAAQDHFGALQDAEVAIELADAVLLEHPDNPVLHAYRSERQHERQRLIDEAPKAAATVLGLPFRRRLSSLISKV